MEPMRMAMEMGISTRVRMQMMKLGKRRGGTHTCQVATPLYVDRPRTAILQTTPSSLLTSIAMMRGLWTTRSQLSSISPVRILSRRSRCTLGSFRGSGHCTELISGHRLGYIRLRVGSPCGGSCELNTDVHESHVLLGLAPLWHLPAYRHAVRVRIPPISACLQQKGFDGRTTLTIYTGRTGLGTPTGLHRLHPRDARRCRDEHEWDAFICFQHPWSTRDGVRYWEQGAKRRSRDCQLVRIIPAYISGRAYSLTNRIFLFAAPSGYLTGP